MLTRAESLGRKASFCQNRGDFHRAKRYFLEAHVIYQKTKDPLGVIDTAHALGDIHRQLEDFAWARRWYEKVLRIQPQNIDSQLGLALCLRGEGKYRAAIASFKRCLKTYERARDHEARAYVHWAIGTTQRFAEDYAPAEKNLRTSLVLAKKLKDKSSEAYARAGLGGTLRMRGRYKESGAEYKRAYAIFRREKDDFGIAYSSCGQGNALRMQNKPRLGIPFMKRAIALYRALDLKGPRAYVLWSLSQAELMIGRVRDANTHLNEAEKLFRAVNDRRGLSYIAKGRATYRAVLKNPLLQSPQIP